MVSSEGLAASVDPWLYQQGFNVDSWLLPDTFSHGLLARALHTTATVATPLHPHQTLSPSAHTLSSARSDPEIGGDGAKQKRNSPFTVFSSQGKATKRRFRASKKSHTTFITVDPSNFRHMVQQVTGAKYIDDSSSGMFAPIVKPELLRLVNLMPCGPSYVVPTLDTSTFLSNHHQENLVVGNAFSDSDTVGLPSAKTKTSSTGYS